MAIHLHTDCRDRFPPLDKADDSGLLAAGGDLSPTTLLCAYRLGIFPWYSHDQPILWWSPNPRCVLYINDLHISRSLAKTIRQQRYSTSFDRCFDSVINACSKPDPAKNRISSWITNEMRQAYLHLHVLGYAHSVEVWNNQQLVGGLYGIQIGRCFFGESMFSRENNVSKIALVELCRYLDAHDINMVDCQLPTPHLFSLGAKEISRKKYIQQLKQRISHNDTVGPWSDNLAQ